MVRWLVAARGRDARLQVGEGVLEQRDGALREAVGVERLLPGGRLQVVRRLQAAPERLPGPQPPPG